MAGAAAACVMVTGCTDSVRTIDAGVGSGPVVPAHAVAKVPGGWLVVKQGNLVRVGRHGSEPAPDLPKRQPPMDVVRGVHANPDGTVVVAGRRDDVVVWSRFDGQSWSPPRRWTTGLTDAMVGGAGEHIAVALGGPTTDGVDAVPIAALEISDDGGVTWRHVDVPPDLVEALSVAVTADGTAFVTTGSGPWLRVRPQGAATVMHVLHPIVVAAVGNRLYAREAHRVLASRDLGRSWLPVPPPS